MMEALGQLAKDGSLLAPTHKHIGASQLTSFLVISYIHIIMHIDVLSSTGCYFDYKSSCDRFFGL